MACTPLISFAESVFAAAPCKTAGGTLAARFLALILNGFR
jgi:hypothetical protein